MLCTDAPLKAFFVDKKTVSIDSNGTANTEIVFLPFNVGKHRCSVVFVNDTLGQFVVNVEATATLPHPISAPFVTKPRSVRISSAAAAGLLLLHTYLVIMLGTCVFDIYSCTADPHFIIMNG